MRLRLFITLQFAYLSLLLAFVCADSARDKGMLELAQGLYSVMVEPDKLKIYHCSRDEENFLRTAWSEAIEMLRLVENPNLDNIAAQQYLGAHRRKVWGSYNEKVPELFRRAAEFLTRDAARQVVIYCESPNDMQLTCRYHPDSCPIKVEMHPWEISTVQMVVCERFFEYPTFQSALERGLKCRETLIPEYVDRAYNIWWYESQTMWLLHAIFHIKPITDVMTVDEPREGEPKQLFLEWPYHEGVLNAKQKDWLQNMTPWTAKKIATNPPGKTFKRPGPLASATNYALFAYAEYLTDHLGMFPDRPWHGVEEDNRWPRGEMCPDQPEK